MHQNNDKNNLAIVEARLHTAKFMYENGYMKGAYNYYSLAVTRAFIIQGRTERLCMFKKYFDKKTRGVLLKGLQKKAKIKWYLMHFPYIYYLLKLVKK